MASLSADLDRFYLLLERLASLPGQGRRLAEYTGGSSWPRRGVYFFFEDGEHRHRQSSSPRVVRVGTHALKVNASSTLWGRLRTHRGSRVGGGNHRGSIFRLHVGAALIRRDTELIEDLPTWGVGQSAPREVREAEAEHERRVSHYIGAMSILWLDIADDPGPLSRRGYIERNAIALLSNGLSPLDPPSEAWLGLHSVRGDIRTSGLWNLNHVREAYDQDFLDVLGALIDGMATTANRDFMAEPQI